MTARSKNFPIKNCDIHPSAAISSSKIAAGALSSDVKIANANVATDAAIALSKLATGALPSGITISDANIPDALPMSKLPNLARVVGIGTVPQKNATCVAGSLAGNSATHDFTIETDPIDVPRNLEVAMAAGWDGGNVTVTGTDQFGGAQTETFTTGSDVTRVGSKIFATVTGAVKAAQGENAAGATIGTGAKIGVGIDLSDSSGICFTATAVDLAATFSSTYDSFTPSVEPNNDTYTLIVNV